MNFMDKIEYFRYDCNKFTIFYKCVNDEECSGIVQHRSGLTSFGALDISEETKNLSARISAEDFTEVVMDVSNEVLNLMDDIASMLF